MKTIKVKNCGECPFLWLPSSDDYYMCAHPESKITMIILDLESILPKCPLKTEAVKIELK